MFWRGFYSVYFSALWLHRSHNGFVAKLTRWIDTYCQMNLTVDYCCLEASIWILCSNSTEGLCREATRVFADRLNTFWYLFIGEKLNNPLQMPYCDIIDWTFLFSYVWKTPEGENKLIPALRCIPIWTEYHKENQLLFPIKIPIIPLQCVYVIRRAFKSASGVRQHAKPDIWAQKRNTYILYNLHTHTLWLLHYKKIENQ